MVQTIGSIQQLNEIMSKTPHTHVLLDVYANWCAPCMSIVPVVEKWAEIFTDILFLKIFINDEIIETHDIESIPAFLLFQTSDACKLEQYTGAQTDLIYKKLCEVSEVVIELSDEKEETDDDFTSL
uniref:Thioredoxin domain-containing protein n=1 Tax=viral metagenome TaxID=1070528 RepID=A0A6C0CS80_9ZZZZ